MKKLITAFTAFVMFISMSVPAFAKNYEYESGADSKTTFGVPTQTDAQPYNPQLENVRRNKDAAYFPPSYGVFSGDIPTDPSSPYHNNLPQGRARNVTNATSLGNTTIAIPNYDGSIQAQSLAPGTSGGSGLNSYGGANGNNAVTTPGMLPPTSITSQDVTNTASVAFSDGSIGILSIQKLNLTVKVFEGETLDNMKKGIGHFEFTSNWDGNIGLAGHNRGSSGYFNGVKNLENGDLITYEAKYGKRNYKVFSKVKIADTDYSSLGYTNENILSLITCVENTPNQRWSIQAQEVR